MDFEREEEGDNMRGGGRGGGEEGGHTITPHICHQIDLPLY